MPVQPQIILFTPSGPFFIPPVPRDQFLGGGLKASQALGAFVVAPTTLATPAPNSVLRTFVKNLLLVAKKWLNLSHQEKKKKRSTLLIVLRYIWTTQLEQRCQNISLFVDLRALPSLNLPKPLWSHLLKRFCFPRQLVFKPGQQILFARLRCRFHFNLHLLCSCSEGKCKPADYTKIIL